MSSLLLSRIVISETAYLVRFVQNWQRRFLHGSQAGTEAGNSKVCNYFINIFAHEESWEKMRAVVKRRARWVVSRKMFLEQEENLINLSRGERKQKDYTDQVFLSRCEKQYAHCHWRQKQLIKGII
jgi:hypothetical protein